VISVTEKLKFIQSAFGRYEISRDGLNISVRCPNCRISKKKKLVIRIDNGVYHCWVCGMKGKGLKYVLKKFCSQFLYEEYLKKFPVQNDTEEESDDQVKRVFLPGDFKLLAQNTESRDPTIKSLIFYLRSRGLSTRDMWYFKLGFSKEPMFRDRVIMPSFDDCGELNYYVARSTEKNSVRKYVNSSFPRKEIVFNEINIRWDDNLTIVEGPFDLVKCDQNSTCLLGSFLSERSLLFQKIVKNETPIILALDHDAVKKTQKVCGLLMDYNIPIKLLPLGSRSDVGEMTKEEFLEAKKNSQPLNRKGLILKKIRSISTSCFV
jgi:DNA primase